jgi:hypothetical protein
MLIEPASKVSVPFTAMTRRRSRVPLRVTLPAQYDALPAPGGISTETPLPTQAFPVIFVNTIAPDFIEVPAQEPVVINPVVLF